VVLASFIRRIPLALTLSRVCSAKLILAGAQVRFVVLILSQNLSADGAGQAWALNLIVRMSKIGLRRKYRTRELCATYKRLKRLTLIAVIQHAGQACRRRNLPRMLFVKA
jgi:hypothetical protein